MRFIVQYIDPEVAGCVYKLIYGDKYIIVKGKTLAGSIYFLDKGYAYFLLGGMGTGHRNEIGEGHAEGSGKNTYYFKFYSYIRDNPGLEMVAEVLFESQNAYQLLKREQQELDSAIHDKNCLNNNVQAYIPQYRKKTRSYGWINIGHVLAFKKHLKAT